MRIDDLRTTLAEHADLAHDDGLHGRAGAVRGRVRAVRRRRAVVAAACVAGAVLAVPAIRALEVTPPEPASERDLAGRTAPESLVSNGFTYDFDEGVEGATDEPLDLRLEPAEVPRLVSWTVNAGGDRAVDGRLVDRDAGPYDDDWTAGGTGFETYEYVPVGATPRLRLTPAVPGADGRMAVAVYTLSEDLPDGISGQGVSFRDEVDGSWRIGAAIGEPGESSVSFDMKVPEGEVRFAEVCTAPKGYYVNVRVAGSGTVGVSCSGEAPADAAGGGWFSFDLTGGRTADGRRLQVGDTVQVTAEIVRRADDTEPVEVPGAFVGLGAYTSDSVISIGATGTTVDEVTEVDGHLWNLAELDTSDPGSSRHVVKLGPVDELTYVELGVANDPVDPDGDDGADAQPGSTVRWTTRIDGEPIGRSEKGPSSSFGPSLDIRLDKGESMTIDRQALSGVDELLSFYVATYTLAE